VNQKPTHVAVTGKAACVPIAALYVPTIGGCTSVIFKVPLKQMDKELPEIQGGLFMRVSSLKRWPGRP
jgi:hypothetical protein